MLRRALTTAVPLGLAALVFLWSLQTAQTCAQRWLGAGIVCACFFAAVLFDQRLPDRRTVYHRLKLVALCCALFLLLSWVPYAAADDWDPALVVDPKLVYASGAFALGLPLLLVLLVTLVPLDRVALVSKKANITVFGVVAALLLIESYSRLTSPAGADEPPAPPPGRLSPYLEDPSGAPRYWMRPGHTFHWQFPSNPRGYFDADNRVPYTVNEAGYRGPVREVPKPSDVCRILIIGDSYAFGFGVRDEDTPGRMLERSLGGAIDGKRVEVVTLAAPGYTTQDELEIFASRGVALQPDLVIVWYAINDIADGWLPSEDYASRPDWEKPWYLELSRALAKFELALTRAVRQRRYARDLVNAYRSDVVSRFGPNWERNRKALLEIEKLAQGCGARTLVVIEPLLGTLTREHYAYRDAHAVIRAFCAQHRIPCYDLWDPLVGRDARELCVHANDLHSNEIANRIFADFLAENLRRDGLLP